MSDSPALTSTLLIASGSILGAFSRYYLSNRLAFLVPKRYWCVFYINIFATFLFGFALAFLGDIESSSIYLFIVVGFLSSFSTFSTFVLDVYNLND